MPTTPVAANRKALSRRMTGPTKAAITFLCLGEQAGSALMQKLSAAQIERITLAMSRLGPIPAEVVEGVPGPGRVAATAAHQIGDPQRVVGPEGVQDVAP